ncbi:probable mannosyl-oligosaccharide alpha-1,2-mannosidase 1B [Aspergillus udagawae]|uniref:Probable mannosyl-oligosaccharide alpha-1,2-mannosidase 1B n=1 Tax=Aspergillus udagawae TaxID=91492 RepID=A0A8H3RLC6_9EURO|nr:probable mannosyl-oligosaccharide alpha-1,2-mannosidase 1B [Aspergillus udagawae]
MCGTTYRPTSNGRIAVMFPSPSTKSMNTYSLFFHEGHGQARSHTRAIFRLEDPSTRDAFGKCESIDLRIERYGDLTSALTAPPLHRFRLRPKSVQKGTEMEFELPERLDLGVSERGIVGRQVTVVAEGGSSEVLGMGMGIVGYD